MSDDVEIRAVEQVPEDARVCHIDELDWSAKSYVSQAVDDKPTDADERIVDGFGCCDIVKYTDYYEVSRC